MRRRSRLSRDTGLALASNSVLTAADLGGCALDSRVCIFPAAGVTLTGPLTMNGTLSSTEQFVFVTDTTPWRPGSF